MRKIKMICTGGPFGDACCSYKFELPQKMTLKEFAELIVKENPNEWGDIRDGICGKSFVEYSHGKIEYFTEDKDMLIESVGIAHGGWSAMIYAVNPVKKEINLDNIDYSFNINKYKGE